MPIADPLCGRCVVVCRPTERAEGLLRALAAAGARPVHVPVLEIDPLPPTAADLALVQRLNEFDAVVVVSPSAASLGLQLLEQWWPQWPTGQQWFAVGGATAEPLRAAGLAVQQPADQRQHSEGLLELPALRTARRILLLKGADGRDLLQRSLRPGVAELAELVLYRRTSVDDPDGRLQDLLAGEAVDAMVVLSGEALDRLPVLAVPREKQLEWIPVLVPGARLAKRAGELGFRCVINASGTSEAAVLTALREHFADA